MPPKVVIIGGGWAGLAAAIQCCHQNIPITLFEASNQLGGRARRIQYHDYQIDNGQHLIIGAYQELLRLLKLIGTAESQVFQREPLRLNMKHIEKKNIDISLPQLPAPFHVINGFMNTSGLTLGDRWKILKMCLALSKSKDTDGEDITVEKLLANHKQTLRVIKGLWEPLCLATMNTLLHEASAEVFMKILRDAFMQSRENSDLLFARTDLSSIIPDPAHKYIQQHNGTVMSDSRVAKLNIENNKIVGVILANGDAIEADRVIIAVPPSACLRLIKPHLVMQNIVAKLEQIEHAPICTVYMQFPPQTRMNQLMIGSIGTTTQWVFDRSITGRPGLMAIVISSEGHHMQMDNDSLCEHITIEVAKLFPDWPQATDCFVIREKRATFKCSVGINKLRPQMITPIEGCLLAGDYTATEYPSTLEGALRSGVQCAKYIKN